MNQIYDGYHCHWQSCFFFGHMNYYSWNLSWMMLFHYNHSLMKTALSRTSGRHLVLDYIFPQNEVSLAFAQTVVSQKDLAADLVFLQWYHYSLQHLTSIPESRTIGRVTIKFKKSEQGMANCWTKVVTDVSEVSKQANYTLSCKPQLDRAINNVVSWREVMPCWVW